MVTTYINGKFMAQRCTGVQRYAHEVVMALDTELAKTEDRAHFVLVCPSGAKVPPLRAIRVQYRGIAGLPLHAWEQIVLPFAARGGLLLSLAGSAPAVARRQACTVHDAAVFDCPEAYSPAFRNWYRLLFSRLAVRAERLFTVSRFSRRRLALALGQAESRWRIVPGAADHLDAVLADQGVLAKLGLRSGRFLLAVASDNPSKNLPRLMAAFARVKAEPGVALVLVGGRNGRVFAESGAASDPPGVVRAGALDDRRLKALYQHARALVFPSLYEGFGLPPLEAMRCGCPAAVSAEGALPEVCGDAAFVLDAHDTTRLAQGLQRLLDDDRLCADLRVRGAAHVQGLQWGSSARALLQALREPVLEG
jgi:glycosyltransferase involved in cell wall biosynthesis